MMTSFHPRSATRWAATLSATGLLVMLGSPALASSAGTQSTALPRSSAPASAAADFTPLPEPPPPAAPRFTNVGRIDGYDRIDTSMTAARTLYPQDVKTFVFASADNYADAIGGARFAASLGAPLILVSGNEPTLDQIGYLGPKIYEGGRIYLLGGPSAISRELEANFAARTTVTRIAGVDRYDTATRVAAATKAPEGSPIYIADGRNFPDGLSVAALASHTQGVVLLSEGDKPSPHTENYLDQVDPTRSRVIAVGGAAARSVPGAPSIIGADRYATSALVAAQYARTADLETIGVATGRNWPDALVGAAGMGPLAGPLLLSDGDKIRPTGALDELVRSEPTLHQAAIFGGGNAVRTTVEQQLAVYR